MGDISHLVDDSFYGAETVKLDVAEHMRTREQRARHDRLLEYHSHLLDRARKIAERNYRYEKNILEKKLVDIRAKTLYLDMMERNRLSAKPRSSPLKLKPIFSELGPKKRSRSLPGIHLVGSAPEPIQAKRPLTPTNQLERDVTFKEVALPADEVEKHYVPQETPVQTNKLQNSTKQFEKVPPLPNNTITPLANDSDEICTHSNVNNFSHAWDSAPMKKEATGLQESWQKEQNMQSLNFVTRRHLTKAEMISHALDKVYRRRFTRKLPPLSKASQEKLRIAQLVLAGMSREEVGDEPGERPAEEEAGGDRQSQTDIQVITGPTATVYKTERPQDT